MKLFEMRNVPKTAGVAKLQFDYKGSSTRTPPFRSSEDIVLPSDLESEFFPLMNGQQFLLRLMVDTGKYSNTRYETHYWFGGTDENPFLVRLRDEPFEAFKLAGEDSFYAELKPAVVTEFERAFRITAKRQGDIFAVPVPHTWDDLKQANLLCLGNAHGPKSVKASPVFETRHKLSGLCAEKFRIFGGEHTLGEGLLEAPDHSPLKLEQVHLIVQAQNLYDPRKAD